MVKAKRKPLEEISGSLKGRKKVLVAGCGGCVSVCLAGGQKETGLLCDELALALPGCTLDETTIERQCNTAFLTELDAQVPGHDALLSMACGAGVQFLAERYPDIAVFPAVNTLFIGVDREVGVYEEKCRACGDCALAYTGGICPVTRCAKSIFNGPCGGTNKGKCEVDKDIPCAWNDIYERLKKQGRLDNILTLRPRMAWRNNIQGVMVQAGFEGRYPKAKEPVKS
ncbi:MAG: methylenetetrahydrofolate reductase C-terminal domain-containing protein [Fibrobacterota bacterium]